MALEDHLKDPLPDKGNIAVFFRLKMVDPQCSFNAKIFNKRIGHIGHYRQADPDQRNIDPERNGQCAPIGDRQGKDRDRPRQEQDHKSDCPGCKSSLT